MNYPWTLSKTTVKNRFRSKPAIPDQGALLEGCKSRYGELTDTKFGLYTVPMGIEVELENSNGEFPPLYIWTTKPDGSLRNGGVEFVSCPVSGRNIDYAIHELDKILSAHKYVASHRCSTHVHINISQLDMTQLHYFVAVYAVVEKLLFEISDMSRYSNPYCYPLIYTSLNKSQDFQGVIGRMKYCALNLNHVVDFGTAEFRHMCGITKADNGLVRWLQCIQKLVHFVVNNHLENIHHQIYGLNTVSNYGVFLDQIFNPIHRELFGNLNLQKYMEDGATWAKLYLKD